MSSQLFEPAESMVTEQVWSRELVVAYLEQQRRAALKARNDSGASRAAALITLIQGGADQVIFGGVRLRVDTTV